MLPRLLAVTLRSCYIHGGIFLIPDIPNPGSIAPLAHNPLTISGYTPAIDVSLLARIGIKFNPFHGKQNSLANTRRFCANMINLSTLPLKHGQFNVTRIC